MPDNNVEAIAQTADGYLWVGTQRGLARFDGVRFTVFDGSNTPVLKEASVRALCSSRDGSLWIGTMAGLICFKQGAFTTFTLGETPRDETVLSILESADGALWVGTGNRLVRIDPAKLKVVKSTSGVNNGEINLSGPDKLQSFNRRTGLPGDAIRSLCEAGGQLWIVSDAGICGLKGSEVRIDNRLGSVLVRAAFADRAGGLWLCLRTGLARLDPSILGAAERDGEPQLEGSFGFTIPGYDPDPFRLYTKGDGLADENVTAGCVDRRGILWLGTPGGVNRMQGERFVHELQPDGNSFGRVNCFFEDHEGSMWVGTRDGLHQIRQKRFVTYTRRDGLTHDNVMSVLEDRKGNVWLGTWGGGLVRCQGDRITCFTKADRTSGLTADWLLSLCEDQDGSLLIGADYEDGMFRFTQGRFLRYGRDQGLTNHVVRVVFRDRSGSVWLGTGTGLVLWNTKQTFLAGRTIRSISEDAEGNLWVGSNDGLHRRQSNEFATLGKDAGLPAQPITSIHVDRAGDLWLGTEGAGLCRIPRSSSKAQNAVSGSASTNRSGSRQRPLANPPRTYTTGDGLFSDDIAEVLEDDHGSLWMSSVKGVFRVRKADFDRFDARQIGKISCQQFGKEDGMATAQCNDFAKPAAWKSRDGRLWFATTKGVAVVDPRSELNLNSLAPAVHFEEIVADKSRVHFPTVGGDLHLEPGRGELEFHYAALSFQVPEKNRFKYRLEGVDRQWIEAGNRRVAYYNNLGPGRYRFRVIASNNDGVWNEKGAWLDVVLLPHFWQTLWFKLAVAAAICGGAWLIYRFRVGRIKELERLRIRIAADLHDELGSSVGTITLLSRFMLKQNLAEEQKKDLSTINRLSAQIADSIRDIVWFINPEFDTVEDLLARMKDAAAAMLGETDWRFEEPSEGLSRKLTLDFRQNAFLMFKEALANVVKHSKATCVEIRISIKDGSWEMCIRDNGTGFNPGEQTRGNGLKNLRRRADKLKGTLQIQSRTGDASGTTVLFSTNVFHR